MTNLWRVCGVYVNSSVQGTSGLMQGGVPVDARIFLVPELLARDSDGVRQKTRLFRTSSETGTPYSVVFCFQ